MALLHRAKLTPTKLELLKVWLPGRIWFLGPTADLVTVASYRFDDPAGEVGLETLLVRSGSGEIHQVPLTYRGAPLADADVWLAGTMEHSVLGQRWVYDAEGDPVYRAVVTSVIRGEAVQAEEFIEVDGAAERRERTTTVVSAGAGAGAGEPAIVRRPTVDGDYSGPRLTGTWAGQPTPVTLVFLG